MIRTAAIFLALLLAAGPAGAGEEKGDAPGLHTFMVLHAVVGNLKETDDASNERFLAFYEEMPRAAFSLADFWWRWAIRDCRQAIRDAIDFEMKRRKKDEDELIERDVKKERNLCVQAFIFDRWDDINRSIANKQAAFKKDEKR